MKFYSIVLTILLIASCETRIKSGMSGSDIIMVTEQNDSLSLVDDFVGTWEYIYPYNTTDLIENHYLVFDTLDADLKGWYYGTSDDFDESREGYLPGFFVVEMESIDFNYDTLHFSLSVSEDNIYVDPIEVGLTDKKNILTEKWGYGLRNNQMDYLGLLLQKNQIRFNVNDEERIFKKIK